MNPLKKLLAYGQSCWMDDLTRHMITSGELAHRVADEDLRGITSNPAIFEKAITSGGEYDSDIARLAAAGRSPAEIYEELVTTDVRDACDILRAVYDQSEGEDGYVSLEVSPHLAHDTQGSIDEARRLSARVGRPNLFIKIPGTAAGVPAVEELIFEGINVNITLLFSIERYEAVARAYLRALERRNAAGRPLANVASVASFFLSRIDTLVDQLLQHRIVPGRRAISDPDPQSLLGQVAIAKAKLAYQTFKRMLASDRWQAMAARGAHVQRMLWASTSAKNAAYHDLMYVEPLVGPYTINTMPRQTIAALLEHGIINATVEEGVAQAELVMADLKRLGIDFGLVAAQLENEGIQKFIDAYDALLKSLATKRENMAAIIDALHQGAKDGPTAIIARTEKGKGVSFLEGANAWHGKPLDREQMNKALAELGDVAVNLTVQPQRVGRYQTRHAARPPAIKPDYRQGEAVATQPGAPR